MRVMLVEGDPLDSNLTYLDTLNPLLPGRVFFVSGSDVVEDEIPDAPPGLRVGAEVLPVDRFRTRPDIFVSRGSDDFLPPLTERFSPDTSHAMFNTTEGKFYFITVHALPEQPTSITEEVEYESLNLRTFFNFDYFFIIGLGSDPVQLSVDEPCSEIVLENRDECVEATTTENGRINESSDPEPEATVELIIDPDDGPDYDAYFYCDTAGDNHIIGTEGNDYIYCYEWNDTLEGGPGNDSIFGGDGDDIISGGDGDDFIDGWGGNDIIDGGGGDDFIYGWFGDDTISGGEGNDIILSEDGDDTISGGPGNDEIYGGNGDDFIDGGGWADFISGGPGNDNLGGGGGNDDIRGGDGDDILRGNQGDDTISGGPGDDTIGAGAGNDYIDGGAGNDDIQGGIGDDIMFGANGDDYFIINSNTGGLNWISGGPGIDTVDISF